MSATRRDGPVLVGNGQGFWGDSVLGPTRLVREGPLHYLTLDYLAEVTMSIMQKVRARDPNGGFATDFVTTLTRVMPDCIERGIKVIANAGGVNPMACAAACARALRAAGITGVRIGVVEGDDVFPDLADRIAGGSPFLNLDTGAALGPELARVRSANAYLGARPIVDALAAGADVVVTGRCADASLTVAPLVHEFGWSFDDWDQLASATVAGHILECGTQATGGNFTGWRAAGDLTRIGYPVVEVEPDGTFVVTKHESTGGLVNTDTVTAQLLYEIGDPARYLTPDVVADFTTIRLTQDGPDRVRVGGVRGREATDTYKVSCSLHDGFKAVAQLTVAAPDAVEKANVTAQLLFDRLALDGTVIPPEQRVVELLGAGVCFPGMLAGRAADAFDPPEVVLRIAVRDADRRVVDRMGMEVASLLTSGPPGLTGFAGGRPKASEVLSYWPALVAKASVDPGVTTAGVES